MDPNTELAAALAAMRDDTGKLPAFTSLGGYTMAYYTQDGLTVCAPCANKEDTSDPVIAGDVYWEGPELECDDCVIESAYGDPDAPNLDAMVRAYVIAGLWSTTDYSDPEKEDSGGDPLDANFGPEDMAPEAMASIRKDCEAFIASAGDDLHGMDAGQAGHDFLLTRDGHGA